MPDEEHDGGAEHAACASQPGDQGADRGAAGDAGDEHRGPARGADGAGADEGAGDPAAGLGSQVDPAALRTVASSMQAAMRSALRGISVVPPAGWSRALGQSWPVVPAGFHAQVTAALAPGLRALQEQLAALPPVVDPAVFRAIGDALPKINLPGLARALERLREALPPNWDSVGQYQQLAEIAREDGIPVVWVPPGEVLTELVAASDRSARLQVLRTRQAEVLASCREVLSEVAQADMVVRVPQALEAITALESGLAAAAQTLAVAVTEAVLTAHVANGRTYKRLADDVDVDVEELSIAELRGAVALLPVIRFYTTWWSSSGTPPPAELSRHVTVHLAPASHLTVDNALVAVMLLTSVLRDLDAAAATPASGAT